MEQPLEKKKVGEDVEPAKDGQDEQEPQQPSNSIPKESQKVHLIQAKELVAANETT